MATQETMLEALKDSRATLSYWSFPNKQGAWVQEMRSANIILAVVDKQIAESGPDYSSSAVNFSAKSVLFPDT